MGNRSQITGASGNPLLTVTPRQLSDLQDGKVITCSEINLRHAGSTVEAGAGNCETMVCKASKKVRIGKDPIIQLTPQLM